MRRHIANFNASLSYDQKEKKKYAFDYTHLKRKKTDYMAEMSNVDYVYSCFLP